MLRPELAASLGTERFLAVVRATARLQHPHTCRSWTPARRAGHCNHVVPHIDGESLRARSARRLERLIAIDGVVAEKLEVEVGWEWLTGHAEQAMLRAERRLSHTPGDRPTGDVFVGSLEGRHTNGAHPPGCKKPRLA